jgi:8-oxo-dGTP pyrophosphatase MutT (NUDIX family)
MKLIEKIQLYKPYNEQEEKDKVEIIQLLKTVPNIFERENKQYHMTASAWVVNKNHTKVLMIYHNIYNSWSWLGGHADGETDLLQTAIREVKEESGVKNVYPVSEKIYSLEILTVDGHEKKGNYVSSHLHINITFLLQADENERTIVKSDENSGVTWFELQEAINASTEEWFQKRIYKKLNEKLKIYSLN